VTLSALIVAGTLLVATPKMRDPEFSKSVVLVIYAKDEGVIGIVLNRPMNGVYKGGPLPLGTNILVQATQPPPASLRVLPRVCLLSGKSRLPAPLSAAKNPIQPSLLWPDSSRQKNRAVAVQRDGEEYSVKIGNA